MRVLLIWPRNPLSVLSDELSCCEPLPLEYVGGALRARHDVELLDLRLDEPLASYSVGAAPDLVGLAIPYTTMLRSAHQTAREVRRMWPTVPLVIGGHHPTMSREWLNGLPADFVVVGEGGRSILALADQLERHGELRDPVAGLGRFSDLGRGIRRAPVLSLEEIPPPDRSLVARHRMRYFHSIYRPVALVRFSAGCPYQCNFCSLWRLTDRKYLTQSAERVVQELASLDVPNIYVVDDEAFIQPQRMLYLADAVESAGIRKTYHMYVRTDTAVRNPDVIERWAAIGLDSVLVGAESMSDRELVDYMKGTTASVTRDAISLFHRLGIKVRANFIVNPDYTEEDFEQLARTVADLEIDLPSFSVLTPLPGTVLYAEKREQLIANNPDLYDCYHTLLGTRLPIYEFYRRLADLLQRTAQRPTTRSSVPLMFYFSNSSAFGRMVEAVRQGYQLNGVDWDPAAAETPVT